MGFSGDQVRLVLRIAVELGPACSRSRNLCFKSAASVYLLSLLLCCTYMYVHVAVYISS